MTEQEVQAFCANNGISVSAPGEPLFVVDPENLPPPVKKFVNDDGTYKGDDTPEAEDPKTEDAEKEGKTASKATKKTATKARAKKK